MVQWITIDSKRITTGADWTPGAAWPSQQTRPTRASSTSAAALARGISPLQGIVPGPSPDQAAGKTRGQIVALDFDGARGVTYAGPVRVEGLDVPRFSAGVGLGGAGPRIIAATVAALNAEFAPLGVRFATHVGPGAADVSTVYVGGNDSLFAAYGSFLGLAEQVDAPAIATIRTRRLSSATKSRPPNGPPPPTRGRWSR